MPFGAHRGTDQSGASLGQSRQAGPAGGSSSAGEAETLRRRGRAVATAAPVERSAEPRCHPSPPPGLRGGRQLTRKLHQSPATGDERAAASRGKGAAAGATQRTAEATYPWCRRGLLLFPLLPLLQPPPLRWCGGRRGRRVREAGRASTAAARSLRAARL